MFLEISENSEENTCARVSFLKKRLSQVFSCDYAKFLRTAFFPQHLRASASDNCDWLISGSHIIHLNNINKGESNRKLPKMFTDYKWHKASRADLIKKTWRGVLKIDACAGRKQNRFIIAQHHSKPWIHGTKVLAKTNGSWKCFF